MKKIIPFIFIFLVIFFSSCDNSAKRGRDSVNELWEKHKKESEYNRHKADSLNRRLGY